MLIETERKVLHAATPNPRSPMRDPSSIQALIQFDGLELRHDSKIIRLADPVGHLLTRKRGSTSYSTRRDDQDALLMLQPYSAWH